MTTTPDPKLVQELATELMLDAARDIDYMGIGEAYFDDDRCAHLDDEQKSALQDAINEFISEATITVTRPAEQPTADQDGELGSAFARIQATLERHAARGTHGGEYLDDDIRSILAGRLMWKRSAETRAAEQDGDVRAVARLKAVEDEDPGLVSDWLVASAALYARFADRFAALDARDADGSVS